MRTDRIVDLIGLRTVFGNWTTQKKTQNCNLGRRTLGGHLDLIEIYLDPGVGQEVTM